MTEENLIMRNEEIETITKNPPTYTDNPTDSEHSMEHLDEFSPNSFFYASCGCAISCSLIRVYLVYKIWETLLLLNFSDFYFNPLFNLLQNETIFLQKLLAFAGAGLASIEPFVHFYTRMYMFNSKKRTEKKMNFIQMSLVSFPVCCGFFPQYPLSVNHVNLQTRRGFYFGFYKAISSLNIFFLFAVLLLLLGILSTFFFTKKAKTQENELPRDLINTIKTKKLTKEKEREKTICFCKGIKGCKKMCFIWALLFIPCLIGLATYSYVICSIESVHLQVLYIIDLCLNFLYIFFYSLNSDSEDYFISHCKSHYDN